MSRIEELEKQITELHERKVALQKELELEKQKTEIEYPFDYGDYYWYLNDDGMITTRYWDKDIFDRIHYKQGLLFHTKEEAEKECDRRMLLTRFRQFRDKCNGDWKPDFKDSSKDKYIIYYDYEFREFYCSNLGGEDEFHLFGYFKIRKDCERAIELFGDEIKKLFVEEEK